MEEHQLTRHTFWAYNPEKLQGHTPAEYRDMTLKV